MLRHSPPTTCGGKTATVTVTAKIKQTAAAKMKRDMLMVSIQVGTTV